MSEPTLVKSKMNKGELISYKDFDDVFYKGVVSYVMRQTKDIFNCKEFFHHTDKQIYRAFQLLQLLYDDVNRYYEEREEGDFYKITYKQFEAVCKKYIDVCRDENNRFAGWVLFDLLVSTSYLFEKDSDVTMFEEFESSASKEDLEYANKHFSKQHNSLTNDDYKIKFNKDTCRIVNYRGLKIYEYTPWSTGYLLDNDNKIHEFPFEWDWWYLIDKYIYLDKGWKEK